MDLAVAPPAEIAEDRLALLHALEKKLLWLSAWMVHNANHIRPNRDGLKVGGHQASCASSSPSWPRCISRSPARRTASPSSRMPDPVFHAINYLFGRQTIEKMAGLRALGGVQSYPARVKDGPEVDFSTGSVGLGVAMTTLLRADPGLRAPARPRPRRPVRRAATSPSPATPNWTRATSTRPCWRAGSTTSATSGGSSTTTARASIASSPTGCSAASKACSATWAGTSSPSNTAASWRPPSPRDGGEALRSWIDDCPNTLYSALTFQGGAAWRQAVLADLGRSRDVRAIIDPLSDDDLAAPDDQPRRPRHRDLIDTFHQAEAEGDQPTCFIAYTIKGMGLPFAGHKDNHAGMMTKEQMETFRRSCTSAPDTNGTSSKGWISLNTTSSLSSTPAPSPRP